MSLGSSARCSGSSSWMLVMQRVWVWWTVLSHFGLLGCWAHGASGSVAVAVASSIVVGNDSMICDDARLRCAYRTGCGYALQYYLTRCAAVLEGDVDKCPESCQHALIALMSTDEGKELIKCTCAQDDRICIISKQRVEICRSSVLAELNRTRVSCRVATWICHADTLCSTALSYYNVHCKSMFLGKKCTHRCKNSIGILRRQEKADKLNTCICDGSEEYDCPGIHRNMENLCIKRKTRPPTTSENPVFPYTLGDHNGTSQNNDCSQSSGVHLQINATTLLMATIFFLLLVKD